jgi:hypothetical protein
MDRWKDKHSRYGWLMMEEKDGRWYWDNVLQDISYVPRGSRTRTRSTTLSSNQNDRQKAFHRILKLATK